MRKFECDSKLLPDSLVFHGAQWHTDFQSDDILPACEEVFQWAEKSSNPSSVVKNLHTSKKKSKDQPLFNG